MARCAPSGRRSAGSYLAHPVEWTHDSGEVRIVVRSIGDQRHVFEIPRGVAYFDSTARPPQLKRVRRRAVQAVGQGMAPWCDPLEPGSAAELEPLRGMAAHVMGASPDTMAVMTSCTDGMMLAAINLPIRAGQRVVLLQGECSRQAVVWKEVAEARGARLDTLVRPAGMVWDDVIQEAVRDGVAVVVVPEVHRDDGAPVDVAAVGTACRRVGAALVVDASQSAGVQTCRFGEADPDLVVATGDAWLLGPPGWAFVHVPARHHGWGPLDTAVRTPHDATGARRFDVGGHVETVSRAMMHEALQQICAWGAQRIQAEVAARTTRLRIALEAVGMTLPARHAHADHVLLADWGECPAQRRESLAAVQVFVGGGLHGLRFSTYLHNDSEDIARLTHALVSMARTAA